MTKKIEQEEPGRTTAEVNIQKEAVCLSLKMGMLRTRRRIATSAIQTDADPSMVHVSKDILESTELGNVNRFQGDIKRYLQARCLPSPFRSGVYLLKLSLVEPVLKQLEDFEAIHKGLVAKFLDFYKSVYEQRNDPSSPFREKLGTLYNVLDYPHPQKVAMAFRFDVQLWEIGTPGALKSIDRALYEREAAKMQNVWEEARQSITQVLLQEFRDLTKRMADRLQPGEDGKPRVFRDSLVGNLQEWLDIFDSRALTSDEELIAMVRKARAMVSGIKPETLRDSDGLRADLARDMQGLTQQLDVAIVTRPGRMIEMDEEVPA